MKIISERQRVTTYHYNREFMDKSNNFGFSFSCDEFGNLLPMTDGARINYEKCINGEFPELIDRGVVKNERSYMQPAIGICDKCGKEVSLENQYCGACQCGCGQWYNLMGQALVPPEQWEEQIDDD